MFLSDCATNYSPNNSDTELNSCFWLTVYQTIHQIIATQSLIHVFEWLCIKTIHQMMVIQSLIHVLEWLCNKTIHQMIATQNLIHVFE